jgi:hypothetical protein
MVAGRVSGAVAMFVRVSVVAVVVVVVLAGALPAFAADGAPAGVEAPFADCPLKDALVELCVDSVTTGGELRIGRMVVPITKTFVSLEGGLHEEATGFLRFLAGEDGKVMQRTSIPVPGGLSGVLEASALPSSLRTAFDTIVNSGLGGLTATVELAGLPSAIHINTTDAFFEEGVALEEPMRMKLNNPFLGENCYVGSASDPIELQATTGTTSPPAPNKPIKGTSGTLEMLEEGNLVRLIGNLAVDNAFAVPAASGCGGSLAPMLDRAIDSRIGLPSPPGHNALITYNTLEEAISSWLRAGPNE